MAELDDSGPGIAVPMVGPREAQSPATGFFRMPELFGFPNRIELRHRTRKNKLVVGGSASNTAEEQFHRPPQSIYTVVLQETRLMFFNSSYLNL